MAGYVIELSIVKKIFWLFVLFNSLLTAAYGISVFFALSWFIPDGQLLYPYLLGGYVILALTFNGSLNAILSALLSRKYKTGRFLFHHFVYGLFVIVAGYIFLASIPSNPLSVFFIYDTSVAVNAGRIVLLIGATLVIDDVTDIHNSIDKAIKSIKSKISPRTRALSIVHFVCTGITFYLFISLCVALLLNPLWATASNIILIGNLTLTMIISLVFLRKNVWDNLPETEGYLSNDDAEKIEKA